MKDVWKIGAWPGLWGKNTTKNKERFVKEYALKKDFVALGYGWIKNIKNLSSDEIDSLMHLEYERRKRNPNVTRKRNEVMTFANEIAMGDFVLLYYRKKAYLGKVLDKKNSGPYYYVGKRSEKDFIKDTDGDNIAPHRIDVEWLFNQKMFKNVDFSMWRDTVHKVEKDDLDKIKNQELKSFLMKNVFS